MITGVKHASCERRGKRVQVERRLIVKLSVSQVQNWPAVENYCLSTENFQVGHNRGTYIILNAVLRISSQDVTVVWFYAGAGCVRL